jgi:hypothetical protein
MTFVMRRILRSLRTTAPTPNQATERARGTRAQLAGRLLPALVVLACMSCWPAVAGATSSSFRSVSAVNGGAMMQLSAAQLNTQLTTVQTDGVQVVRADAAWANIEPAPPGPNGHGWQLAQIDAWVRALATHHLSWQPIIDFSVWWAKTCPGFCAPTNNTYYSEFAQEIASRYGAHGSFWSQNPSIPYYPAQTFEIWNEENVSTYWMPAARYATLYLAAHDAIHAVDPTASVIVGGLADDSQAFNPTQDYPAWYVFQMFAADPALRGHVDGFGLHPYGSTASAVEQWVAHFRGVLTSVGEGSAPIDITEVGWPTGDTSYEGWRAAMMNRLALDLSRSNCGIGLLAPYDWINPGQQNGWSDFGLVKNNGNTSVLRKSGMAWFNGLGQAVLQPELSLCATTGGRLPLAHTASTSTGAGTGQHGTSRAARRTVWSMVSEVAVGSRKARVRRSKSHFDSAARA